MDSQKNFFTVFIEHVLPYYFTAHMISVTLAAKFPKA